MNPSTQQQPRQGQALLGLLAACSAGMLWGTGALVVDVLVSRHGFSPENISFWRFSVGALVLLAVYGRQIDWAALKSLWLTLVAAGAAMAGYVLCWFLGIERIGPSVPTLIALCLPPVLVTLIGLAQGTEAPGLGLFAALCAALAGTVMLVLGHGAGIDVGHTQNLWIGVAFSVASALLYTGFTLVSSRLSVSMGPGPSSACLTVIAAVSTSLFALIHPFHWPDSIPPQAWFLYLGLVTAALALLAFSWGSARLSPSTLTVATLMEPLTAVLLSAMFLNQSLRSSQLLGGALLLLSIWVLGRRQAAVTGKKAGQNPPSCDTPGP